MTILSSLEIATLLQQQASDLIQRESFESIFGQKSKVIYTGSYALDLMVYPDIDVYLDIPPEVSRLDYIAECCRPFIANERCFRVKVEKQYHVIRPQLPKGTFVSLKFNSEQWKMPWKFDIWGVDQAILAPLVEQTEEYRTLLSPETRRIILDLKHCFIIEKGRSSKLGSHNIYNAVLKHNVETYDDLIAYLKSENIAIPEVGGPHSVIA